MGRRKRVLVLAGLGLLVAAPFVRVGYARLGWGGYFYLGISAPWKR